MKNSNGSRRSSVPELLAVTLLLILIVAAAARYFYSCGYLLYYGDAQAHLNISRSWIDGRHAGYDQIGTVWLPVLHLICLPFAASNSLWKNGLAGTIPVAACFVVAGVCLYLCAKDAYQSWTAALVVALCFALNPNVLYLATIAMTEVVFAAGLSLCLLSILCFRRSQNVYSISLTILASWWMSLTRYDGWFLLPFIAVLLALAAKQNKIKIFLTTGALGSLAPFYWLIHNWWETGNALDFYNGPYSAAAIQNFQVYEGFHNWPVAFRYYWEAARFFCGDALLVAGVIGLLIALLKGPRLALAGLIVTPFFYVWSVHSSWLPIRIPSLPPFSYYNTRYTLVMAILMAFAAGALAKRLRVYGLLLPLLITLPWQWKPIPDGWICWKESERNSSSRRAWTATAAEYLAVNYRSGQGILFEFGDLTGIFEEAGIPLKETLHEGDHASWFANSMPNGVVHQMKWAIAQEGDKLALNLNQGKAYHVVDTITVKGAPNLLIYERN